MVFNPSAMTGIIFVPYTVRVMVTGTTIVGVSQAKFMVANSRVDKVFDRPKMLLWQGFYYLCVKRTTHMDGI